MGRVTRAAVLVLASALLLSCPNQMFRHIERISKALGISIRVSDTDLPDHGSCDFGLVRADGDSGAASEYVTFTIENRGTETLTLSDMTMTGGDFDKTDPLSMVIAPSGSTTCSIRFDPVENGSKSATVTVHSDDRYRDTYTFTVTGTGIWGLRNGIVGDDSTYGDAFGCAVAISGDFAIIGADSANSFQGCVYSFLRASNPANWTQREKLTASDGAADDRFGGSVSLFGKNAVMGAMYDGDKGSNSGSAYLFTRLGDTYSEAVKWTADDGAANDLFGVSVSVDDEHFIAGAHYDDTIGSAYIFYAGGESSQWFKLTGGGGSSLDQFGRSVSISAGRAIVGVSGDDDRGTDSGSAYVFHWDSDIVDWIQQAKLTASDGAANDSFGSSVSISGDYAVVGAHSDDGGTGSAYVFHWDGSNWTQQAKLMASDGAAGDYFGRPVSISGDRIIIGAYMDDDNGTESGSAYIFVRSGASWTQQAKLTANNGAAGDYFGCSVCISGTYVIVGASGHDSGRGAAYIFEY
jgi:hypothetical protein